MTLRRPYEGLTIVEAVSDDAGGALALAAGMTGRILSDLGATVVRSKSKDGNVDPSVELFLSAGKSVIPAAEADGSEIVNALAGADAAIVDPIVLHRLGRDTLPPLCAVLSFYGDCAADTDVKASAFTLSAVGGLLAMVGDPNREPLRLGGHQEAFALGLSTYCGLAAALAAPSRPQRTIRASLLETIIWLNWKAVPLDDDSGPLPMRAGAASEWQVLGCADGYAVLVYQEPDWSRLKQALAEPRLDCSRFDTRYGRLAHAPELAAIVEERFMTMTRREIHSLARRHRLPLGPVWSLDEAFSDPHNLARALFTPTEGNSVGDAIRPRLPVGWNGRPILPSRATKEAAL